MTPMENIITSLQADWQSFLGFSPKLMYAAVVLVIAYVASVAGGRLVAHLMRRSTRFRINENFLRRLVSIAILSMGVLLALQVLGFTGVVASLFATGGILAIVLGFAFREIGENFLAGFFLSFSRPFELGDVIQTGDLNGVVRGIELRHVHVRTAEACDVFVPSAQIFREPLYNYTRDGLRRPAFTIGIAYDHDPNEVIGILKVATQRVGGVLAEPASFVTIKDFADQYVSYEVFFWVDIDNNEQGLVDVRNAVKAACWAALREAQMTFSSNLVSSIDVVGTTSVLMENADVSSGIDGGKR